MRSSIRVLVLLSACFACHVFGASRPIQGGLSFYYDPTLHHFVCATSTTCFVAPLTRVEQDHVHTTQGIEDLEVTMMRDWMGKLPEIKVYHDDVNLPDNIKYWCSRKDIFLLQRNMTSSGTPVSPLG